MSPFYRHNNHRNLGALPVAQPVIVNNPLKPVSLTQAQLTDLQNAITFIHKYYYNYTVTPNDIAHYSGLVTSGAWDVSNLFYNILMLNMSVDPQSPYVQYYLNHFVYPTTTIIASPVPTPAPAPSQGPAPVIPVETPITAPVTPTPVIAPPVQTAPASVTGPTQAPVASSGGTVIPMPSASNSFPTVNVSVTPPTDTPSTVVATPATAPAMSPVMLAILAAAGIYLITKG
jgi:hypothetical protein